MENCTLQHAAILYGRPKLILPKLACYPAVFCQQSPIETSTA